MGSNTSIEWTDATLNPIRARSRFSGKAGWFCERVSEGCKNCYASKMNLWRGNGAEYAADKRGRVEVYLDEKTLIQPLRWRSPKKIFMCDMTDIFGEWVPDEWIDLMVSVMARTDRHIYQVLTKRPERMRDYLSDTGLTKRLEQLHPAYGTEREGWQPVPLDNLWLGVSVEDQKTADERIPLLLQTPAAVRFVSYEPALGPVNLAPWIFKEIEIDPSDDNREYPCPSIDWVIAGGESGPGARPAHPDWFRNVRDQCQAAGVPFFFKQWGAWRPITITTVDGMHEAPFGYSYYSAMNEVGYSGFARVGKKKAGHLLDGREWREFPK